MQLINKLTDPGDIKKVELHTDTVQITTRYKQVILYRRVVDIANESVEEDNNGSIRESSVPA